MSLSDLNSMDKTPQIQNSKQFIQMLLEAQLLFEKTTSVLSQDISHLALCSCNLKMYNAHTSDPMLQKVDKRWITSHN